MADPSTQSPAPVLLAASEGVASVTLNREGVRNAYDGDMVQRLLEIFVDLRGRPQIRAVVVQSVGSTFCAGADLTWMQRLASVSTRENLDDAGRIAAMFRALDRLPQATLALVQGPCLGGAVGLVAACDVAIAARAAEFGLTEVRLGLVPSVVAPYVVRAIGTRRARRMILTGDRLGAEDAHRIGLIHELVDEPADLSAARDRMIAAILASSPAAIAASKELIEFVAERAIDDAVLRETAVRAGAARTTPEAEEGMAAFLQQRRPNWFTLENAAGQRQAAFPSRQNARRRP